MTQIQLIIINYKSEDIITNAIKSIDEKKLDVKITILDNGCTNEAQSKLPNLADNNVEVLYSPENLGFAGGCNFVAEHIKYKYPETQYIFLLNPDALMTPDLIFGLLAKIKQLPNAAAISPKILDMEGNNWFTGTMINWKNCSIQNNPIRSKILDDGRIDIFNGCGVLLDFKKFNDVGMFNADIFLYYDEAFLSMSFLASGYNVYYDTTLSMYHHISYSTSSYSVGKSYYMTRNHIYFFNNYKEHPSLICSLQVPIKNFLSALKHLRYKAAYGIVLGIFHAFINKKGPL